MRPLFQPTAGVKPEAHVAAHRHSSGHRDEVAASERCGCFYCLSIFAPAEIEAWVDEPRGGLTAVCPRCGTDACIGDASGYPITTAFLGRMKDYWF